MKLHHKQFLGLSAEYTDLTKAAAVILPIPYEGGVSYGAGAAKGPDAVLEASTYLELYDEDLGTEPYRVGIATLASPPIPSAGKALQRIVYAITAELIETGKFLVLLGGDHSVSAGCFRAMNEAFGPLAVIQIDAHADLRDTYEDSPESHACIMSRIREITRNTLQLGIRSMSAGEARRIERERIALCTMAQYRKGTFDLDAALHRLPERIYLTLDVDALDWGVVRTTGTPEPGGFGWDEILALLKRIFEQKQVMGFDVVELSGDPPDRNSAFAVAKLIYRMLGFKMANVLKARAADWPDSPSGPLT